MDTNKVIQISEYKRKKAEQNKNKINNIDTSIASSEEEDRRNTFNLFMRVLSTIREESY